MRTMRQRSFFEIAWSIFRFAMKTIFIVLSVVYVFAGLVVLLVSPDLGTMPAHQVLASIASAAVFGIVLVSYLTLVLAVPVSAFCALTEFVVTGVVKLYENTLDDGPHWHPADDLAEPGAIEVVSAEVHAHTAVCPVCAARFEPDVEFVSCLRCEAPHHPECWTYIGSCATFGCGSDRARMGSQPAPAATPEWAGWREKWSAKSGGGAVKPN